MTQSTQPTITNGALEFAIAAAELAYNTRCVDVIVLDLRGRSPVTEFFVIATGTSPRQMRTAVEELQDLGKKMNFTPWKTSGLESGNWILLDCVHVVCHLFDGDGRAFYDLELLWGDCPKIDWRKELGLPAVPEVARDDRFSEESHLDQIDAQEEEERDLTELEDDEDADEDADVEPAVVVEFPDETDVELVEIDPPSTRGKRQRSLYPTKIADPTSTEEEAAMHVIPARSAAEILDDEAAVPLKPIRRSKKTVKKAVKKTPVKKTAAKKAEAKKVAVKRVITKGLAKPKKKVVKVSAKAVVKKAPHSMKEKSVAKKATTKKMPTGRKRVEVKKKPVVKKAAAKPMTKKTAKKPAAKKRR
ncbi:MAG: ribosome silencing factor [Phycisphaerales bacterium]|nr:ribosome silencing factor [Phycisphaerales bacterium]